MSNNLSSRQWNLDTPVAFGSAGAVLWTGNIRVLQIEWSGYTTAAAATVVIKDQTGRIVWTQTVPSGATAVPVRVSNIGWINGLVLDTLSGGVVTMYTG